MWALSAFGPGFAAAGQGGAALDSVRWGADYLLKVHRQLPGTNNSLLVTRVRGDGWGRAGAGLHARAGDWGAGGALPPAHPPTHAHPPTPTRPHSQVGDIDAEMLLWYRPEDAASPRPAYAVDAAAGGADLGGSVAAALAAASSLFQARNETQYAARLLAKAQEVRECVCGWGGGGCPWGGGRGLEGRRGCARGPPPPPPPPPTHPPTHPATPHPQPRPPTHPPLLPQVYAFARAAPTRFTDADFNATLLYNSSTRWDDVAWAAAWLYKATKQEGYLG